MQRLSTNHKYVNIKSLSFQNVPQHMKTSSSNLVWLDLEMTGLDPASDRILEIATVVTDKHLNILGEGPVFAIHQKDTVLDKMDEWNVKHHGDSGLLEKVQNSRITEKIAEDLTIEFLSRYILPGKSPICGNSICQDRRFLVNHMPRLEKFFHYRNLDVSSIKILAKHWYPNLAKGWKKNSKHEAMSDIHDSINELKYYREHIFRKMFVHVIEK